MDKITQALKKILPADQVDEVAKAVEDLMAEQYEALQKEFEDKLNETYETLAEEKKNDEAVVEQGYQQAYEVIDTLMARIDEQRAEFEKTLEEGFNEAYEELEKEKAKNKDLEMEIYAETEEKLKAMNDLMIDKVDEYLTLQEAELYESAKRDVMSDPRILEQRVAVEKMVEILSDYISNDDLAAVSSSKIEEAYKNISDLKSQMKILEQKNFNLQRTNNKLNEQVREAHEVITEAAKVERKERVNKKGTVSGRGQRVMEEQIITEFVNPETNKSNNANDIVENHDPLNDLLVLSGLEQS